MVGTGHGRKWRIRLDDDREIDVHAKSLAVEAKSTRLPLQETEESDETESVETGNDYNGVKNGSEIDMEAFCDGVQEEMFASGWVLNVDDTE
jgi:hypothetical protein